MHLRLGCRGPQIEPSRPLLDIVAYEWHTARTVARVLEGPTISASSWKKHPTIE